MFWFHDNNCEEFDDSCAKVCEWEDAGIMLEIDRCIAPEVEWLWRQGIATYCSCCGHKAEVGYILVSQNDAERMKSLGYEVHPTHHKCDMYRNTIAFVAKNSPLKMEG